MAYRMKSKLAVAFTSLLMLQRSAFPQISELPTFNEFAKETLEVFYAGFVIERDCNDKLPYGIKPSFVSKEFFTVMKKYGLEDEKKISELILILKSKAANDNNPNLDLLKGSKSDWHRRYLCRSAVDRALFKFERQGEIGRQLYELFLNSRDRSRESDKKIGIVVGRDVDIFLLRSK